MKTKLRVLFFVTVFLFGSACATAQTTAVPAGSANAAVKQLETDLADARSRSIDVLSPGSTRTPKRRSPRPSNPWTRVPKYQRSTNMSPKATPA